MQRKVCFGRAFVGKSVCGGGGRVLDAHTVLYLC